VNNLADVGQAYREGENAKYFVQTLPADSRRFSARFSRDCGAKKTCVARR